MYRLFPDLTADDRTEVDQRLHPLMERLDNIRVKLKSMAKQGMYIYIYNI